MNGRESAIAVRARCQCFREAGLTVDRNGDKGRERKVNRGRGGEMATALISNH